MVTGMANVGWDMAMVSTPEYGVGEGGGRESR